MKRLPLTSQLMLLLSAALSLAFVGALAVTVIVQRLHDRNARDALAANRVAELLLTFDALAPQRQNAFARDASNKVTTVKVTRSPAVLETAADDRSAALAQQTIITTGREDVRASVLSRANPTAAEDARNSGLNREVILISVPLDDERWLNFSAREPLTWYTMAERSFLLTVFACSLLIVLGAVWLFLRRVTRPIDELANAARQSAKGDRSARVSVRGPAEVRQAAQAFNMMQEKIAQFDAERLRTIAALGHDLRTPLTSLRIRAEMIDREFRNPMIATLEEVTAMADGLVAYGRTGHAEDLVEEVRLRDLLQSLCEDRGISVTIKDDPVVRGGAVSLTRAIRNLIDNAVTYGGKAEVALFTQGPTALISVKDNGPGIDPTLLNKVFEPFVRGEASRNKDTGGAGLGLSIAREIILAHGGDLSLCNNSKGGVLVRVSLPVDGQFGTFK